MVLPQERLDCYIHVGFYGKVCEIYMEKNNYTEKNMM